MKNQSRPVGCRDSGNQSLATFETLPELRVEIARRAHQVIRRLPGGLDRNGCSLLKLTLYTQARIASRKLRPRSLLERR